MELVKLLMKCGHETLQIELKDGSVVEGVVSSADMSMNVHLKKVKIVAKNQTKTELPNMTVRGNTIRYVLLPSHMPLDSILKSLTASEKHIGEPAASQQHSGRKDAMRKTAGKQIGKVRRIERA